MTHRDDDRRAELIAAALSDDLSPAERIEFDELRASDPTIDREMVSLGAVALKIEGMPAWLPAGSDEDLRARIESIGASGATGVEPVRLRNRIRATAAEPADLAPTREPVRARRWWPAVTTAAACLAVGLVVGGFLPGALSAPPSGPPGTLGAIEAIDMREETGVSIDADLVAHTWGTEAILDATGLDTGATYAIVMLAPDGSEFSAGEMLGSTVPIHCSVNAAVLREDVSRLEVRSADGAVVASADLPRV